ncbi:MAG: 30S ribosomal protein S17e [Candidatus Aenigmarchaeota archaeon]|nr:30S ribosomal protein S17e [Candidatus Aenigmarchaeota archaeon]
MGRIKTISIKSLGNELIKDNADKFTDDFDKNKIAIGELKDVKSKKQRNVLAGYITREMRKAKKSGL